MSRVSLMAGDNRISLAAMIQRGEQVDSVVTDAPYGYVSIVNRMGSKNAAPVKHGKDGAFARVSKGFMGHTWDGSGIERDPEFWRLVLQVLKPGGYCFAFSGARTGHWQAVAMEQAGFVMHPMHVWAYGQGFPKAHSARDAGPEWEGWAYGTQAQKPALEPIYLAQRPFSEKNGILNIQKHGVGAVNIDGCRVPTTENLNGGAYAKDPTQREDMWGEDAGNSWRRGGAGEYQQPAGRYPANLIHDGSAEVVALFPDSASGKPGVRRKVATSNSMSGPLNMTGETEVGYADSGSAARFFNSFEPDTPPIFYHPKAGKDDRAGSKHPTVKPIGLMQHLIRHITPPGGVVLDPFAGSGTTAEAARREGFDCILMEAEPEYVSFLKTRFLIEDDLEDLLGGTDVNGQEKVPTISKQYLDPLLDLLG